MTMGKTGPLTTYFRFLAMQPLDAAQRNLVSAYRKKCSPQGLSHALCDLTSEAHDHPKAFRRAHSAQTPDTMKVPKSFRPRRRRTKGHLSLTVSPAVPFLHGGLELASALVPPAALSFDHTPMERWLTHTLTGLSKDHPSDATTLEALPLSRLKEAARALGFSQVWRTHMTLRKHSNVTDRTAWPSRMSPRARAALDTIRFFEFRFSHYPHLQAFTDLLSANDCAFFGTLTSRLQVIVGEPLTGSALLNRGRALRQQHPEERIRSSSRCHQLYEDAKAIYGSLCVTSGRTRSPREVLLQKIAALQACLEFDCHDLTRRTSSVTNILEPKYFPHLHKLLQPTPETPANEARILVAREVQQLMAETSRALGAYRAVLTDIEPSIRNAREQDSLLTRLRTSHEDYRTQSDRLASRLHTAQGALSKPGRPMSDAGDLFPFTEIDLLLSALQHTSQLEAGMSVRTACASVETLPELSKRVLCRMIARQLGLPH